MRPQKKRQTFYKKNLVAENGRLLSIYLDSPGKDYGFGEDYAFYTWGLLELYKITENIDYLNQAIRLQEQLEHYYFDDENGGFYISAHDTEQMIVKNKEIYDGAVPSYNSVIMHNLFELYKLTGENKYLEQLLKTLKFFSHDIARYPQAHIHSISLVLSLQKQLSQINVCTNKVCRPPAKNIEELISYF